LIDLQKLLISLDEFLYSSLEGFGLFSGSLCILISVFALLVDDLGDHSFVLLQLLVLLLQ
jgi:hypothetical protein